MILMRVAMGIRLRDLLFIALFLLPAVSDASALKGHQPKVQSDVSLLLKNTGNTAAVKLSNSGPRIKAALRHYSSICRPFNNLFAVSFVTENKRSSRGFTFDFDYDDLRVHMSNVKGIVEWSEISSITYRRYDKDHGLLTMRFTKPLHLSSNDKHEFLVFGLMKKVCWDRMLWKVAGRAKVKFVFSE